MVHILKHVCLNVIQLIEEKVAFQRRNTDGFLGLWAGVFLEFEDIGDLRILPQESICFVLFFKQALFSYFLMPSSTLFTFKVHVLIIERI